VQTQLQEVSLKLFLLKKQIQIWQRICEFQKVIKAKNFINIKFLEDSKKLWLFRHLQWEKGRFLYILQPAKQSNINHKIRLGTSGPSTGWKWEKNAWILAEVNQLYLIIILKVNWKQFSLCQYRWTAQSARSSFQFPDRESPWARSKKVPAGQQLRVWRIYLVVVVFSAGAQTVSCQPWNRFAVLWALRQSPTAWCSRCSTAWRRSLPPASPQ